MNWSKQTNERKRLAPTWRIDEKILYTKRAGELNAMQPPEVMLDALLRRTPCCRKSQRVQQEA